ncbi:response regulator [Reichenbachiella agarivorans]|uniref:Response regulator n=1 Tax=Reichenbachiella agarivorans TaxID=2979464 RepID=A0ABY6CKP5_9BACT|nr:response regulator [Reichenbachiella agarivorans]UXP31091.1 response regulator [Reichenbachiella agarivorans]
MEDLLNRSYKTEVEKKYTVLYVDDEEVNLRVFNRNFSKFYHVLTAIDAFEAQTILSQNEVDLIITDQCMPRMNGSELLLKIVPLYPDIIRMIMTGFSDENDISEVKQKVGLHKFLKKPWDPAQLQKEFDHAFVQREDLIIERRLAKAPKRVIPRKEENLDLLESTMSLVETSETKQLKKDINNLVKESKTKKAEFMDGGINFLQNLKDAMLPIQQELKLYTEDAFIVYDKNRVNQNGYWFGETNDCLVIASFHSNTHTRESLALNSFVSAMLTEIVYKEKRTKTHEILNRLSTKIHVRFLDKSNESSCPLEIAVLVYDRATDKVSHSGAYHNAFFLNERNDFKTLVGNQEVIVPGKDMQFDINAVNVENIKALYIVPFNILEETNDNRGDSEALRLLLEEMRKVPFGMQAKMFEEYGYRSVIALKL